jgi:hypothetical protein
MVVEGMEPSGTEGFMPRKRHYGFLNAAVLGSPEKTARVAAHELGHGAWHLQHPFHQFNGAQEGGTQTLMDYGEGSEVLRYHWGEVHDPVSNFTLFDDDLEGGSVEAVTYHWIIIEGATDISPFLRPSLTTFEQAVLVDAQSNPNSTYTNGNFYDIPYSWYLTARNNPQNVLIEPDDITIKGLAVKNGVAVAGESAPQDFYLAYDQDELCTNEEIGSAYSTGFGDPPLDKTFAIGGVGPIIIDGLKYGRINEYYPEAYDHIESGSHPPQTGWPPDSLRSFLKVRSNNTYKFYSDKPPTLGKLCVGVSNSSVIIYVQQDGASGLTLDMIRDEFERLGCRHAISLDGSDSTFLFKDGSTQVAQGTWKPGSCTLGLKFTPLLLSPDEECD